jgi:hypothetical protein
MEQKKPAMLYIPFLGEKGELNGFWYGEEDSWFAKQFDESMKKAAANYIKKFK